MISTVQPIEYPLTEHTDDSTTITGDSNTESTMPSLKKGDMIIKKKVHEEIVSELATCIEDNKRLVQEKEELEQQYEDMPELKRINMELEDEIERLKQEKKDIIKAAQASGSLKKALKLEVSKDVEGYIAAFMKDQGFRNTKFASTPTEVAAYVKKVWFGIKDYHNLEDGPLKLTYPEFARIYTPSCLGKLSLCRQYVQCRTQEASYGKFCLVLPLIQRAI